MRKVTDEFAKFKNFNPLDAGKWYAIKQKEIREFVCCYLFIL
jgi:hypothetical protein